MDIIESIRSIAKSDDYQNLYILSKEIGSIKVLDNSNDFTYLQNMFFKYLNFYYNIYADIGLGEVDELVLKDFLYEDAYIMWKNKSEKDKYKPSIKQREGESPVTTKWIFKDNKNQVRK
jgi:hypothetical protein